MSIQTAENRNVSEAVPRPTLGSDRELSRNWPEQIFEKLREANIRQIAYVPDAGHARLIELCHAEAGMKTTVLTTEEEGSASCRELGSVANATCSLCRAAALAIASARSHLRASADSRC
jgi:hypothetical protein